MPPSRTGPETTTTTGPGTTTTTEPGQQGLETLAAPDPFAIAERALEAPLAGFGPSTEDPGLAGELERRIAEMDVVIQAMVWEALSSGDDLVVAASIYPYADFRGDPSVLPALADLLAGDGEPPAATTVDGHEVLAVPDDGAWWYLWGNHTHILVTAGPEGPALDRIGQLASHNAEEYLWQAGDCVAIAIEDGFGLPYSPHGEDVVVPCDRPHQYEVVAGDATRFGPVGGNGLPGPGEVYVKALIWCEEAFAEQIGADEFDSSLEQVQFFPDPLEWERGDRYTACVVMLTDEAVPRPVDAAFAGRGDEMALARAAGDCHTWTVREPRVDCAEPHDFEYLGEVAALGGRWEAAADAAGRRCQDLLEATASPREVDGVTLGVFTQTTGPSAWASGDRRAACFAVADQAGLPVRIAGSVAGEWEPAGVPGGGLTA